MCVWYLVGGADRAPSWLPGCETWSEARTTRLDWPAVCWNTEKNLTRLLHNRCAHVKQGDLQFAHVDTHSRKWWGVAHAWRRWRWTHTHTHMLSGLSTFHRTSWKHDFRRTQTREDYSQAQNTLAKFILQPDCLQYVSDELQLNTHKHRDTHVSASGKRCSIRFQWNIFPQHAARVTALEMTVWRTWKNMQFRHNVPAMMMFSSGKCTLVLWTLSPLPSFFFPTSPFHFHWTRATEGVKSRCEHMFQHAPSLSHSLGHIIAPHIRQHPGSFWRTWLILNEPAVCWNKFIRTPCFHKSPLSHLLQNNRKKMCLIHILRTSGKPSTSPCRHQQHRPPVTPGWEFQLASLM